MKKKFELKHEAGLSVFYDLDRPDLGILSYEEDREKIHQEYGGQSYYTARSGLSAAGWIPNSPGFVRVGEYGCERSRCGEYPEPTYQGWGLRVARRHHQPIDREKPLVATKGSELNWKLAFVPVSWEGRHLLEFLGKLEIGCYFPEMGNHLRIPFFAAIVDDDGETRWEEKSIELVIYNHEYGRGLDYLSLVDIPGEFLAGNQPGVWSFGTWIHEQAHCQQWAEPSEEYPEGRWIRIDQHGLVVELFDFDPVLCTEVGSRAKCQPRLLRLAEDVWRLDLSDKSVFYTDLSQEDMIPEDTPEFVRAELQPEKGWKFEEKPAAARLVTPEMAREKSRAEAKEKVTKKVTFLRDMIPAREAAREAAKARREQARAASEAARKKE